MKNRIIGSVVQKARNYRVNRKYKDRLFRLVFQDKEDLLSLYNAVNGTAHTNAEDLTIKTLEDAVYLGFKNDLSFLISNTLNLYEHQSSINPNMPLRGLIYFTEMLKAYVEELEAKGMKVMQTGWIDNDVHYYVDSEDKLGFILELGNGGAIGEPDYRYPAE